MPPSRSKLPPPSQETSDLEHDASVSQSAAEHESGSDFDMSDNAPLDSRDLQLRKDIANYLESNPRNPKALDGDLIKFAQRKYGYRFKTEGGKEVPTEYQSRPMEIPGRERAGSKDPATHTITLLDVSDKEALRKLGEMDILLLTSDQCATKVDAYLNIIKKLKDKKVIKDKNRLYPESATRTRHISKENHVVKSGSASARFDDEERLDGTPRVPKNYEARRAKKQAGSKPALLAPPMAAFGGHTSLKTIGKPKSSEPNAPSN